MLAMAEVPSDKSAWLDVSMPEWARLDSAKGPEPSVCADEPSEAAILLVSVVVPVVV